MAGRLGGSRSLPIIASAVRSKRGVLYTDAITGQHQQILTRFLLLLLALTIEVRKILCDFHRYFFALSFSHPRTRRGSQGLTRFSKRHLRGFNRNSFSHAV